MSFVSRFRRGSADEVTPAIEAVLTVDQHALSYRTSDWYGHAHYHVRVFLPGHAPRPVVVIGDLDNHPVAALTEGFAEIAAIVAKLVLGRPGVPPARLDDYADWLGYFPAGSASGERFCVWHGSRCSDLRRQDAESLAGGALGTWQRHGYTAANLERRAAQVIRVRPGDL